MIFLMGSAGLPSVSFSRTLGEVTVDHMTSADFVALIEREVAGWEGVSVEPHRFGGVEFRLGRRELGHLHRGGLADLPFPVKVREQLVAEGKAEPHHILPESGWVSRRIRNQEDVAAVVELFRLNYTRAWNVATNSVQSPRA
jgi:hypothetical protein